MNPMNSSLGRKTWIIILFMALSLFMALGIDNALTFVSRLLRMPSGLLVHAFLFILIGLNLFSLMGVIYPVYH